MENIEEQLHNAVVQASEHSQEVGVLHVYYFASDTGEAGNRDVDCHWHEADVLAELSVPCVVTPVPTPPMPNDPDGSRDWGPVLGGYDGVLHELLKEVEGESWYTGEATRRRVFVGFSGGGSGALRAAAMEDGPWCGLVVLWCGWTRPDGEEGTRALSPEEINNLILNLTLEDTNEGETDFPNWTRNNAAGRALDPNEARVLAPQATAGRERCERVLMYAQRSDVPGCEHASALRLAERLNDSGLGAAVVTGPDVRHEFHKNLPGQARMRELSDWIRRRVQ